MSTNRLRFLISPKPPIVHDELPHIGAGLRFSQSPTNYLKDLRAQYGDTFLVDVFGFQLFCVFSAEGLKSLYAAGEDEASFGMATFDMLGFKTPIEVFLDADIDLFYDLLKPQKVEAYLVDFSQAISLALAEWGDVGDIDVFDTIRTLEQRVGFRVWIGEEACADGLWQQLKSHFDVLSQESAFVSPQQTLETLTSGKAKEKQAIIEIMALISGFIDQRIASQSWPDDNLTFLYQRFQSDDPQVTLRKVTHNIINANQGFLSNLYAALAWALINLQRQPHIRKRFEEEIFQTQEKYGESFYLSQLALDSMVFCEQVLMESIRVAQRSLTLRKVMKEIDFNCGNVSYTIQPGVYIATMLSVTNTQTPELAAFNPDHYQGRRIHPDLISQGKETISTFGHGKHACPAQKFSHNMCKVLFTLFYKSFEFGPADTGIEPSVSQMGGVSRSAQPVLIKYQRKK